MPTYTVMLRITTDKTQEEVEGIGGERLCTWTDAVDFNDDIAVVRVEEETEPA